MDSAAADARRVTVTWEGEAYLVTVVPSHPLHPPQRFADHREARGAACGIRLVTRWPMVDECEQPGASPAGKGR